MTHTAEMGSLYDYVRFVLKYTSALWRQSF